MTSFAKLSWCLVRLQAATRKRTFSSSCLTPTKAYPFRLSSAYPTLHPTASFRSCDFGKVIAIKSELAKSFRVTVAASRHIHISRALAMAESVVDSRSVAPPERLAEDLERPALDNRSYRVIRLPNKLEALLIHDPDTDKVSAALDVNVGSFSDAEDMPGMAHAVEHLLFMGTKKVRTYSV